MRKKQKQKGGFWRIFSSKVFLFLIIFIFAGMAKATFDKYVSWRQANSALTEVEEKIQSEQQKSKDLKKEIDEIRSEEYIERVTKERLNLVKPGEKVIYVLPEPPAEQEESNEEIKTNEGLWEKIKGIFVK